jgi:hypothetical protein
MAHSHDKFEFLVDGAPHRTDDKTLDGRQVRAAAALTPARDYVLIQIIDGIGRSIGLEDPVELDKAEPAIFLSFRGDRIFTFTLNERGWEWGAATIRAEDLYRYGNLDEDIELVLDGDRDTVVPPDGEINLSGRGVEHVQTRESRTVTIKVNARQRVVERGPISFEQLVALAFPDQQPGPNTTYTITYRKGPAPKPEGSLLPGQSVNVKNGMIFNVRSTDKS